MSYVLAGAAVVTAGVGVYKAVKGANQSAKAERLAKSNIFTPEEMPYEVGLGTDLAARNYTNGMPGTANARNDINHNAASSFYRGSQGATSGGDILDLATRIGQGSNTAMNQLNAQEVQYKSSALGEYEGALGNQANWRAKLYQNNTLQPYLRTANLAASMYGAGQHNLYSGIDEVGSAAVGYAKGSGGFGGGTTAATPQTGANSANWNPGSFGWQNNAPALSASGGGYPSPYPQQQIVPYQIPNNS